MGIDVIFVSDRAEKKRKGVRLDKINLREARLSANLTMVEVAKEIGVAQSTITSWETGKSKPNNAELYYMAMLYGCDVGDIFLP